MAASMEANIRTRFWVALALSALVVFLSPMGEMLGIHVPLSAAARSWTLLALTTPIVFWCGWIFIDGAFRALRALRLDMSVLIGVGVFAAYAASVYLTAIGSKELFDEAAAMLVTFVLFGHWMEMKSRRVSSDALHALFNLVPPKARVRALATPNKTTPSAMMNAPQVAKTIESQRSRLGGSELGATPRKRISSGRSGGRSTAI